MNKASMAAATAFIGPSQTRLFIESNAQSMTVDGPCREAKPDSFGSHLTYLAPTSARSSRSEAIARSEGETFDSKTKCS
jgi:hypothetical protein